MAAPLVWRCLNGSTMARFHIPLIEPDMQISRIRLSDKSSRFRVQRLLQFLIIVSELIGFPISKVLPYVLRLS